MAFVFNAINNQLEDQKANIFGNQPGASAPGPTPSGASPGADGTTDVGSGGGGSSSATPGPKPVSASGQNTQRTQATINKAAQNIKTPGIVSKIGGNLQNSQAKVQEEANAYGQAAKQKSFNLDQSALEGAASGDQNQYGAVAKRLDQQQADRAEQFKPQTQYQFQEVQDIQSNPGIKSMYKREVGPQYSRGEGAFDAMLLQKNPEFLKQRSELVQKQQALNNLVGKEQTDRTAQAQADYDANFARDTGDIKTRLGGIGESQLDAARRMAEEVNARRAGIDIGSIADQEEQALQDALAQELSSGGTSLYGRAGKLLKDQNLRSLINEGDYIKKGGDVGMEDVLDENQASKFNRVAALLGDNRMYQAGKGAGEDITKDSEGLREALKQTAVQKRMERDAEQQAKLSGITSSLGSKAYQMQLARDQDAENYRNQLADMVYAAQNAQGGGDPSAFNVNALNLDENRIAQIRNQLGGLNFGQYGDVGKTQSWRDLVDQSNLGDINALYEDLGYDDRVQAGSGVKTDFDRDRAFNDALSMFGVPAAGNDMWNNRANFEQIAQSMAGLRQAKAEEAARRAAGEAARRPDPAVVAQLTSNQRSSDPILSQLRRF